MKESVLTYTKPVALFHIMTFRIAGTIPICSAWFCTLSRSRKSIATESIAALNWKAALSIGTFRAPPAWTAQATLRCSGQGITAEMIALFDTRETTFPDGAFTIEPTGTTEGTGRCLREGVSTIMIAVVDGETALSIGTFGIPTAWAAQTALRCHGGGLTAELMTVLDHDAIFIDSTIGIRIARQGALRCFVNVISAIFQWCGCGSIRNFVRYVNIRRWIIRTR